MKLLINSLNESQLQRLLGKINSIKNIGAGIQFFATHTKLLSLATKISLEIIATVLNCLAMKIDENIFRKKLTSKKLEPTLIKHANEISTENRKCIKLFSIFKGKTLSTASHPGCVPH